MNLICKDVIFYSEQDEIEFTNWIKNISAIKKFYGKGNAMYLEIPTKRISDKNLREILALLFRYKIDMSQLKYFVSKANKSWFLNEKAYWYNNVFTTK